MDEPLRSAHARSAGPPPPHIETLAQAFERWINAFDVDNNWAFGDDGYRIMVYVVDAQRPVRGLTEWSTVAHLSLRDVGNHSVALVEVHE